MNSWVHERAQHSRNVGNPRLRPVWGLSARLRGQKQSHLLRKSAALPLDGSGIRLFFPVKCRVDGEFQLQAGAQWHANCATTTQSRKAFAQAVDVRLWTGDDIPSKLASAVRGLTRSARVYLSSTTRNASVASRKARRNRQALEMTQ